ncbi:MAG TPA: hypothetical protein V6D28_24675 [Leptolyngbyaceae cyanobacterium]
MTQQHLNDKQQAELEEILQIAKLAEQKAKEMSDLATAISLKYQKRLHEANLEATDNNQTITG